LDIFEFFASLYPKLRDLPICGLTI